MDTLKRKYAAKLFYRKKTTSTFIIFIIVTIRNYIFKVSETIYYRISVANTTSIQNREI